MRQRSNVRIVIIFSSLCVCVRIRRNNNYRENYIIFAEGRNWFKNFKLWGGTSFGHAVHFEDRGTTIVHDKIQSVVELIRILRLDR